MADLTQYVAPAVVGTEVYGITRNSQDALRAGGYAAWVQSVTGTVPEVVEQGNVARLVMSEAQISSMQDWLDKVTTPNPDARVQYEIGPVLKPWVMKKATGPAIGVFIGGALAGFLLKGMF